MSGSMANYTFGNTPSADANKLQWVKIKDGDKTLLICDRVILVNVSWDDLNGQGYVTGKTVTIDGAKYKCRLLTGGSNYRNGDTYAGGTPTNNEWDRFITREEVISGLPAPVSSGPGQQHQRDRPKQRTQQVLELVLCVFLVPRDLHGRGVVPRVPWVQFGPRLELERLVRSGRVPRFPPRP